MSGGVGDYISMTDEQEDQLKQDIRELLDWHCREEIPRYTRWLTEPKQDVTLGHLQNIRVSCHQKRRTDNESRRNYFLKRDDGER